MGEAEADRGGVKRLHRRWSRRSPRPANRPRFLDGLVLLTCAGVLLQAFALEPFRVPTGSMAPALLGQHRACLCPRCGMTVVVGRAAADHDGDGGPRYYSKTFCPNCGQQPLPLGAVAETAGDQVLVNKTAYRFRRPRRWEVVVFRLFGMVFIKRIAGLPGESVELRDGDLYVDGKLARKTYAQARAMRVPLFEDRYGPTEGWTDRWEGQAEGPDLVIDGRDGPQTLTCRTGPKCLPVQDEYAYNAGQHPARAPVHDFLLEADVEVRSSQGTLALRLCDGQDWVEVTLPVGSAWPVETRSWPANTERWATPLALRDAGTVLRPGRTHRIEMAFVDRRVNLHVDGRPVVANLDLPAPDASAVRAGVGRPLAMVADGAAVALRNVRLFRDVHYTGRTGGEGGPEVVRLGLDQYFVLGDNSANSEDSRFWPRGAVTDAQLIGPAFVVHLPSQPCRWQCAGQSWQFQLPALGRVRWLH